MSAVGNRKLASAQMCLFSYGIAVTQTEQQTVGNINMFYSFIVLMRINRSYPLYTSVCGQYTGSIASLPHCYARCMCVCVCACVVWRLWWMSFCLWLAALCTACFQLSDTRALQNFYVKLMSLQITQISVCAGTKPYQTEVW